MSSASYHSEADGSENYQRQADSSGDSGSSRPAEKETPDPTERPDEQEEEAHLRGHAHSDEDDEDGEEEDSSAHGGGEEEEDDAAADALVVRSAADTMGQPVPHSPAMKRKLDLLADCCRQAEAQYEKISFELKVPLLDDTLYRKYLFPSKGPSINDNPSAVQARLVSLLKLLDVMAEHKEDTLQVLEQIARREECLDQLRKFNSQTIASLEIQASALQLLYTLQKHTLAVVEAIVNWRSKLSMPFPFMRGDENYLLKIAETMKRIENSQIGKVLPLQYATFPLLSNVPSVKLFEEDSSYLTYPMRSQKPGVKSAENPVFRKRLATAEAVILGEVEQQLNSCHFLLRRCEAGYFIPIMDLAKCGVYTPMRSASTGGGSQGAGGGAFGSLRPAKKGGAAGSAVVGVDATQSSSATGGGGGLGQFKGLLGIKIRTSRHQQELTDALISTVRKLGGGPPGHDAEEDEEEEEEEEEDDNGETERVDNEGPGAASADRKQSGEA